jgi:hypothetical protein
MWDGEDTVRHAIVKPLGRLEFRTAESRQKGEKSAAFRALGTAQIGPARAGSP